MSTDKLRVGIIGVGFFAIFSHIPNLQKTGRAEVVSRPKAAPGPGSLTLTSPRCSVSSLVWVPVGTGGASGGTSRAGEPEQFGPRQGGFAGVGVSPPLGQSSRPWVVSA